MLRSLNRAARWAAVAVLIILIPAVLIALARGQATAAGLAGAVAGITGAAAALTPGRRCRPARRAGQDR